LEISKTGVRKEHHPSGIPAKNKCLHTFRHLVISIELLLSNFFTTRSITIVIKSAIFKLRSSHRCNGQLCSY